MIYTTGTIAISGNTLTGTGTNFTAAGTLIRNGCTVIALTSPPQVFQITAIGGATSLTVTPAANPAIPAGTKYSILLSDSLSVDGLAQDIAETFTMYQRYMSAFDDVMNGTTDVTITINGTDVTVPGQKSLAKKGANSDITSLSGLTTALSISQGGTGATNAADARTNLGLVETVNLAAAAVAKADLETELRASAYIKDASRHAVERASGGRQTVLYDDLGNPSVMNIIPIFRYEDLGYSEDMGAGVVSCFDVGTGAKKSEIFIGAFQSSLVGNRAVSLPRVDPAVSVNFDAAKGYCANKGAGWHLMTMHEWAAISLWCMANGFEPRGNTNYGRAHDRYVELGRRIDGGMPGDSSGKPRVHAGSGPDAWRHNNSPWGISDLVGNVWEWLDGFKLQDGKIIASTFNTQAEASWAEQAAYFDSTLATGGAPRLSDAVVNRLGTIGDNSNGGYSAGENFAVMAKTGTYVSNQLLKRLLVEPSTVLPKGRVYMRNFGERLPSRGGDWNIGSFAGLAALYCLSSRVFTGSNFGFRLAFA